MICRIFIILASNALWSAANGEGAAPLGEYDATKPSDLAYETLSRLEPNTEEENSFSSFQSLALKFSASSTCEGWESRNGIRGVILEDGAWMETRDEDGGERLALRLAKGKRACIFEIVFSPALETVMSTTMTTTASLMTIAQMGNNVDEVVGETCEDNASTISAPFVFRVQLVSMRIASKDEPSIQHLIVFESPSCSRETFISPGFRTAQNGESYLSARLLVSLIGNETALPHVSVFVDGKPLNDSFSANSQSFSYSVENELVDDNGNAVKYRIILGGFGLSGRIERVSLLTLP